RRRPTAWLAARGASPARRGLTTPGDSPKAVMTGARRNGRSGPGSAPRRAATQAVAWGRRRTQAVSMANPVGSDQPPPPPCQPEPCTERPPIDPSIPKRTAAHHTAAPLTLHFPLPLDLVPESAQGRGLRSQGDGDTAMDAGQPVQPPDEDVLFSIPPVKGSKP